MDGKLVKRCNERQYGKVQRPESGKTVREHAAQTAARLEQAAAGKVERAVFSLFRADPLAGVTVLPEGARLPHATVGISIQTARLSWEAPNGRDRAGKRLLAQQASDLVTCAESGLTGGNDAPVTVLADRLAGHFGQKAKR
jgi:hypothetical protein